MVEGTAFTFAAGPRVVERAGEQVSKEELGGARLQAERGTVSDSVPSEEAAFDRVRTFLSYMPTSVLALPPRAEPRAAQGDGDWLLRAIPRNPRQVFRIRPILHAVLDADSFFEIGARHARSIVTGLARVDGHVVAVVASDPYFDGGALSAPSARKLESFIDLASTFSLPVVQFADLPGVGIGVANEEAGALRAGVRVLTALHQSRSPWLTIVLRRLFGVAGGAHYNPNRIMRRYAWPSARWGSLPIAGGTAAAFRSEIAAEDDTAGAIARIEERIRAFESPMLTAETFGVEELIDPRETRECLVDFVRSLPRRLPTGSHHTTFRA